MSAHPAPVWQTDSAPVCTPLGCPLPSGGCPRSLLADQPNDQAIVVEIAPIPFAIARNVFWSHFRGVPGECPESGLLDRPLIGGLAPPVPTDGGRRGVGDKLCLTDVPVLLRRLAQHGDAILRAVGLAEGERRIDRVGDEAPALHQ